MSLSLPTQSTRRIDTSTFNKSMRCKQMHPKERIEKVIDKPYYLEGVRVGCAGVSDCLSEFLELSLSNYLGLIQTYALAYTYVLGHGRTPDVFFSDFAFRGHFWQKIFIYITTSTIYKD